MQSADLFQPDRREPLGLETRPGATPAPFGSARYFRFEFSSRGDRVPGRLLLPPADFAATGAHPLILLQHGMGGSKESAYLDSAVPWVHGGAAVASIDFPLHGERHSGKLSEQLIQSIDFAAHDRAEGSMSELEAQLWVEFARQAVLDLRRCLDALTGLSWIDEKKVAFAGFSLGAMLGSLFCGVDERPVAAALALAGGGFGPAQVDPCALIGRVAPRPLLFVSALRDERVPRRASEQLFEAAGEPKTIEWFDSGHATLPGAALKAMWTFLRAQLGLAG